MNYRGLKELQLLLRQMYKILTDLLPITRPSLWTNYAKLLLPIYPKILKTRPKTRQFIRILKT